jgi:hypothetical protein
LEATPFYPEYAASAQSPEAVAQLALSLLDNKTEYSTGDIIEVRDKKQTVAFHS